MLPKFRPAILGGREAPPRPVIRPVKPTAPPPPPSPPRRIPSGVRQLPVSIEVVTASGDPDPSTLSLEDPPTKRQRSEVEVTFDDPTRVRDELSADSGCDTTRSPDQNDTPRESLVPTPRESPQAVDTERSFDEPETQLAERAAGTASPRTEAQDPTLVRHADRLDGAGFHGEEPSGERPTEPPRTYLPPPDPAASEDSGARQRPREHASVPRQNASVEASYPDAHRDDSYTPRDDSYTPRDESYAPRDDGYDARDDGYRQPPRTENDPFEAGNLEPPRTQRDEAFAAPAETSSADPAPHIPAAALVAQEAAPRFAMGFAPTHLNSLAAPLPHELAQGAMPVQHFQSPVVNTPRIPPPHLAQPNAYFGGAAPAHGLAAPSHPLPHHVHPAPPPAAIPSHRVHATRAEARRGSKVGRFAWFLFGAAFGIFFAFFATGFVPRIGKKGDVSAQPPAQAPTVQQAPITTAAPVVAAPPPSAQPAAPPAVAPPAVAPPTVAASALPAAPAAAAPAAQTKAAAQPVAVTPAPRVRPHAPRRPAQSSAPKSIQNSSSDSEDGVAATPRAAPAAKEKGGDISNVGDLLNAGLAP